MFLPVLGCKSGEHVITMTAWKRAKKRARLSIAAIAIGAIIGAALPAQALWSSTAAASAATAPTASLFAAVEPATDRAGALRSWKQGGEAVSAAAHEALTGSDEAFQRFLDEGHQAAITHDTDY